jgi:hypothetical protein
MRLYNFNLSHSNQNKNALCNSSYEKNHVNKFVIILIVINIEYQNKSLWNNCSIFLLLSLIVKTCICWLCQAQMQTQRNILLL